jgi:UDP-N-acetylglucosamine 1-carboxyvinyltransferase
MSFTDFMCSSFNSRKVIINNIPDIIDINKLITLLENLGVNIQKNGPGSYTFQADDLNLGLETEAFKKEGGSLRGSIMIVGHSPLW